MDKKITLAQINPVTGDLEGNKKQIIDAIEEAKNAKSNFIIFPEMAITGYCCGSLFENYNFIKENERILNEEIAPLVTGDLVCIIGYAEQPNPNCELKNSCAIIRNGKRDFISYDKYYLANDGHHEDFKYFSPGEMLDTAFRNYTINNNSLGFSVLICEDFWQLKEEEFNTILNQKPPEHGINTQKCDTLFVINHSYFYYGKDGLRKKRAKEIAQKFNVNVVYLNPAGIGDIVKNIMIYDGGSFVVNKQGYITNQLPFFSSTNFSTTINEEKNYNADEFINNHKYKEIYESLVFCQKEFYKLTNIPYAQIHLSGGIDSAVAAAISVDALGNNNNIFISNPTSCSQNETKTNAQYIADKLEVTLYWNPSGNICRSIEKEHRETFGESPNPGGEASIHAVTRTVQGLAASHAFNSGIIACGNHTEIVLGWANFHDIGSIGTMSILGDLTKIEVFELAQYINEINGKEIIPSSLYDGTSKPCAELPDSQEDPFDYFLVSGICAELIREKKSSQEIINNFFEKTLNDDFFPPDWNGKSIYEKYDLNEFEQEVKKCFQLSQKSVYKAAQSAPIPIISKISRGFSMRETIINHYKPY